MKKNNKTSKLIKRLGITFVIPFFMLILGVIIILSAGWNILADGLEIASILFNKPSLVISEKQYSINNSVINRPSIGEEFATLEIPDLNLKEAIYHGDSDMELRKGVGHFSGSTIPGEGGNVILSGHKHTYLKELENVKVGQEVLIETNYGTFKYKVSEIKIVEKTDTKELKTLDHERLTLYTCYPFRMLSGDRERMIAICDFIESF